MQQLQVSLNIPIPEDSVLIKKVEIERLEKMELAGVWWTMKDLEKRINKKSEWIKENILYQPRFRERIDAKNGGFVYYPQSQGQTWAFQAKEMAEFLEIHFSSIFIKTKTKEAV